ncbi:cell envelope integrity protein TolA [Luminiphilus sp.]|nr:cell envelope integrity protein TolA [Luminiphilus sp.]
MKFTSFALLLSILAIAVYFTTQQANLEQMIADARAIPASNHQANIDAYSDLAGIQPDVQEWKDKVALYERKKVERERQLIAEQKRAAEKEARKVAEEKRKQEEAAKVTTYFCLTPGTDGSMDKYRNVNVNGLNEVVGTTDLLSGKVTIENLSRFYDGFSREQMKVVGSIPANDMTNCELGEKSLDEASRRTAIVNNLKKYELSERMMRKERKLDDWVLMALETDLRCHAVAYMFEKPHRQMTCLDAEGEKSVIRFSKRDVRKMQIPASTDAVDRMTAIRWCKKAAKGEANFPQTFKVVNQSGGSNEMLGTALATIDFTAKNAFGVKEKFRLTCDYEGNRSAGKELVRLE